MNILQAIKKMKQGKKIKRSGWMGSGYWKIKNNRITCVGMNVKTNTPHNVVLVEATDWITVD